MLSKSDNNGHFTFMIISCSVLRKMKDISDKLKKKKPHILCTIIFFFRKSFRKIQMLSKSDNNGHFTLLIISRSFLRKMKNISDKSCRENSQILCTITFFFPKISQENSSVIKI